MDGSTQLGLLPHKVGCPSFPFDPRSPLPIHVAGSVHHSYCSLQHGKTWCSRSAGDNWVQSPESSQCGLLRSVPHWDW
jgi:hypothetical protein